MSVNVRDVQEMDRPSRPPSILASQIILEIKLLTAADNRMCWQCPDQAKYTVNDNIAQEKLRKYGENTLKYDYTGRQTPVTRADICILPFFLPALSVSTTIIA